MVSALAMESTDGKAFVEAAQAGDRAGVTRLLAAIQADVKALTFDQAGFTAWYSQHFDAAQKAFEKEAAQVSG